MIFCVKQEVSGGTWGALRNFVDFAMVREYLYSNHVRSWKTNARSGVSKRARVQKPYVMVSYIEVLRRAALRLPKVEGK
jgi:hypothetical protein